MLTELELVLIDNNYFEILNQDEDFIEVKSRNTGHCWVIHKHRYKDKQPIWLYHKHKQKGRQYHQHWKTYTVKLGIESIKQHDEYVLKRKNRFSKRYKWTNVYEEEINDEEFTVEFFERAGSLQV